MAVTLDAAGLRDAARLVRRHGRQRHGNAAAGRGVRVGRKARARRARLHQQTKAATRCAGYLLTDVPEIRPFMKLTFGEGAVELEPRAVGSALRLSGGMALLAPYRTRRAGGLA